MPYWEGLPQLKLVCLYFIGSVALEGNNITVEQFCVRFLIAASQNYGENHNREYFRTCFQLTRNLLTYKKSSIILNSESQVVISFPNV